jgi:hypothetical protein
MKPCYEYIVVRAKHVVIGAHAAIQYKVTISFKMVPVFAGRTAFLNITAWPLNLFNSLWNQYEGESTRTYR